MRYGDAQKIVITKVKGRGIWTSSLNCFFPPNSPGARLRPALSARYSKSDHTCWHFDIYTKILLQLILKMAKKDAVMASNYDFNKIYNEYYPIVLRYVARIVGETDSEDVAQDVFDKVNRNLGEFQSKSKLSTWLYRIATNTAIDRTRSAAYRYHKKKITIEEGATPDPQLSPEDCKPPSTDQVVIQKEMRDCIGEYIETLPPDYKTIIVLSDLEGLANKEIAEILDITLENVKVRLHRARIKLKNILDEACEFYYTDKNTLACDRKQVQIMPKPPK